jgi:hypothetical protein
MFLALCRKPERDTRSSESIPIFSDYLSIWIDSRQYLEMDITLPEDKVHELAAIVMGHLSCTVKELRRLFLVEDFVDSLKVRLGM